MLDHLVWANRLFPKGILQSNTLMLMQLSSLVGVQFINLFLEMPLFAFSATHLRSLAFPFFFPCFPIMSLQTLIFECQVTMLSWQVTFLFSAADVSLHDTLCSEVKEPAFPLENVYLHFRSHGFTNMSFMGGSHKFLFKHGSRAA